MYYHLVTVKKLKINDNFYDIGLIYYQRLITSYSGKEKYNLDVLIPRSLEFLPKSELHKYLQPFRTRKSVFSEKCLAYGDFRCPLSVDFQCMDFKGLSYHEFHSGIPLRLEEMNTKNENESEEYVSSSDSDYDY